MTKNIQTAVPQKVDYNDAVAESKVYFEGDELAATVWVSKYALKDSFGNIYERSPKQMHERIAAEIERIENKYPNPMSKEEVFSLLDHFRYIIPQGGPMTGIGNNFQVASLSNCFVIGHRNPADSYGGIFRMDEEQVRILQSGIYEDRHTGLGLVNVHKRIRLYCGEPYGLSFESSVGKGSTVSVLLPMTRSLGEKEVEGV